MTTISPYARLRVTLFCAAALAWGLTTTRADAGPIAGDMVSVSLTAFSRYDSATVFNLSSSLGATQTFAGAGLEGQDITISSSVEAINGNTVITFNITTPDDFALTNNVGLPDFVVSYSLTIGAASGDALDFTAPPGVLGYIGSWSSNGSSVVANGATGSLAGTAFTGGTVYSTGSYGLPATSNNVNGATYALTVVGVDEVPEPATLGVMAMGVAMVAAGGRRRRRATR